MTALASLRIALVGGGNMARGLIGGLIGTGVDPAHVIVAAPSAGTRAALQQDFGVLVTADNAAAVAQGDVVVLSVKPQIMAGVVRELAPALQSRRPLVISVAAGIRAADLARWIGPGVPVVRAMPNRPALVGTGATGLYADVAVDKARRELADQVLAGTGLAVWVEQEDDLELVTALSGCGPAYFFRLAALMAAHAAARGMDAALAQRLAVQTLAGAGRLAAAETSPDLARMIAAVASRGGATQAALDRFDALGLAGIVAAGMDAAMARSQEMAEQFGKQG
jgi:pyrroline-5-carboxylate reductase